MVEDTAAAGDLRCDVTVDTPMLEHRATLIEMSLIRIKRTLRYSYIDGI